MEGGCLFCFLFWGFFCSDCVKTLWPFPSLMYVLVRMFCHLSMMIYRSSFFYKTNFTLYKDIALFHSSLTLFFCFETKCRIFTNVFCTYVIIYYLYLYWIYFNCILKHALLASIHKIKFNQGERKVHEN